MTPLLVRCPECERSLTLAGIETRVDPVDRPEEPGNGIPYAVELYSCIDGCGAHFYRAGGALERDIVRDAAAPNYR